MTVRGPLACTLAGLIVGLVFTACATADGPAGSTPVAATQTPAAQQASATPLPAVVSPAPASAPPSATVQPTSSASGFAAELISPNKLVTCSSFPRTRFAEYDSDGKPFGVDIEIGQALTDSIGLEPEIIEVPFLELIDAIEDRRCDVTISGQFITAGRLERIAMIPYREGAPRVIVPEGNPLDIDEPTDLCGRSFAVVAGSVYTDMVRGAGDYVGEGINDRCVDAGSAPVDLREFPDQQEAEAALGAGDVDAYAGNEALAVERPGEFDLTFELPAARNGIGHRLDAAALDTALREALRTLIADGRYLAILERYGAESGALTIAP